MPSSEISDFPLQVLATVCIQHLCLQGYDLISHNTFKNNFLLKILYYNYIIYTCPFSPSSPPVSCPACSHSNLQSLLCLGILQKRKMNLRWFPCSLSQLLTPTVYNHHQEMKFVDNQCLETLRDIQNFCCLMGEAILFCLYTMLKIEQMPQKIHTNLHFLVRQFLTLMYIQTDGGHVN